MSGSRSVSHSTCFDTLLNDDCQQIVLELLRRVVQEARILVYIGHPALYKLLASASASFHVLSVLI